MNKLLITGLLLAASGSTTALAADDFTALEKKAWRESCAESLKGDTALCSCVHTLQVRAHGAKTVKINYLSLAMDAPEISIDDLSEASDGLDSLTGGNDSKIEQAMDVFYGTLPENVITCGG
jgi:hypothetical protein